MVSQFHPNDESVQSEDFSEMHSEVVIAGKGYNRGANGGGPPHNNFVPMMNPNTNIENLDK
jgi:hypothetical protein